ncbi:MAG: LysR family transcriptional regulator [Eggerthellales bacterium]|nr:LysR family transcriptional regulator [Eggerthellales bacterium]
MNLQQLRHFVAISQFEHYGRAAKALYVTQSALSNSIRRLEEELGVQLFEHQGRNVVLTPCGKSFVIRVSSILNDLDDAVAEVTVHARDEEKPVRLGVVAALMRGAISGLLNSYRENTPQQTTFDISLKGSTKECIENMKSGILDIAFCGKPPASTGYNWAPLFPEDVVVAVDRNHPLAEKDAISLVELREYRQLSYREPSYMYYVFQGLFKEWGLEPEAAFEDEISALSVTSVNKDAVSIMLDTVRDVMWNSLKIISIEEFDRPFHWVGMMYRDEDSYPKSIQAFIQQMEKVSESVPWVTPIEDKYRPED